MYTARMFNKYVFIPEYSSVCGGFTFFLSLLGGAGMLEVGRISVVDGISDVGGIVLDRTHVHARRVPRGWPCCPVR